MGNICDVAIVGAGPYGLSLAAHLSQTGLSFRIFGKPLDTWRHHVPKGMKLKSDGFASNLSSPFPGSRLEDYCMANGLPYSATRAPVELDHFNAYAMWFQKRFVPSLDERMVTGLTRDGENFSVTLEDGETVRARRVVLAVGITWFAKKPDLLEGLAASAVTHSFAHYDVSRFGGKDVIVLGAGASATDLAAALDDAGASVRIVGRRQALSFHSAPGDSSFIDQIRRPSTGIGPGWRSFFCANTPLLFHRMPEEFRLRAVARHLGPAPGYFMRERIEGQIETIMGRTLAGAEARGGRVALHLADRASGAATTLTCDHVIAATGYKVDLTKLPFMARTLLACIDKVENTPILSDNFETSVDGLYMTGISAANAFGPLLRFMVGSEFAAPRLAAHLRRSFGAKTATKRAA
jgi:thioredoxin reductase